jgi:hypothetical protein
MPSIEDIIKRIINLPNEFHNSGNISMYALLKRTGYFELYTQIDETNILKELIINPGYFEQWLLLSAYKITTLGWYFVEENNLYVVGYYPKEQNPTLLKYSYANTACAAFIKREIESIRTI